MSDPIPILIPPSNFKICKLRISDQCNGVFAPDQGVGKICNACKLPYYKNYYAERSAKKKRELTELILQNDKMKKELDQIRLIKD